MEVTKKMAEELTALAEMKDEDIDYTDIPEVADFKGWEPNPYFKAIKAPFSAKLDKDIIAWLKMHGSASAFLNQICREKMQEEKELIAQKL
jgi:uncharacterized protein (DUF4415 family)